eukprot:CAMPEP_0202441652 /NCGR_PEP_ID=MMETSP1360-20130828/1162_1 /ASSEMBLY_ACC=CAM_ASM_000848 /TAXON_ID=515479 /ORGANISM="Licmophora paradoxa, Strain CCMP2313" /LENGTH=66 /DNA_ID=CAMNT_0049056723 /DNA_START=85 /DNA_END=282 /DNA_ORIENTATION=+
MFLLEDHGFSLRDGDNLGGNLSIDSSNMLHEVDDTARVTVFVIVPSDKLDKVRVEHDTGISIEDGR